VVRLRAIHVSMSLIWRSAALAITLSSLRCMAGMRVRAGMDRLLLEANGPIAMLGKLQRTGATANHSANATTNKQTSSMERNAPPTFAIASEQPATQRISATQTLDIAKDADHSKEQLDFCPWHEEEQAHKCTSACRCQWHQTCYQNHENTPGTCSLSIRLHIFLAFIVVAVVTAIIGSVRTTLLDMEEERELAEEKKHMREHSRSTYRRGEAKVAGMTAAGKVIEAPPKHAPKGDKITTALEAS